MAHFGGSTMTNSLKVISPLAYDDIGRGAPAVLLIPGYCEDREMYTDVANLLGARFRVLPTDLLGHNGSSRPETDFCTDEIIESFRQHLKALELKEIVLVTVAHAGWLGLQLWKELGEQIVGLVWLDWLVTEPTPKFFEGLDNLQSPEKWLSTRNRFFEAWSDSDPQLRKLFEKYMANYGYDDWRRAGREIARGWRSEVSPLKALSLIESPPEVLHIYSGAQEKHFYGPDSTKHFDDQNAFAKAHANYQFVRLHTRSHLPAAEDPHAVDTIITKFVESLRRS